MDQKDRETWTRVVVRCVLEEIREAGCPHGCDGQCSTFHRRLLQVEEKLLSKIGQVPRASWTAP